jgi:hypothetical protein
MNFLEALKIVQDDPTKMAVPVGAWIGSDNGIIFVENEKPCWQWSPGISARIPAPRLLFVEWLVVDR